MLWFLIYNVVYLCSLFLCCMGFSRCCNKCFLNVQVCYSCFMCSNACFKCCNSSTGCRDSSKWCCICCNQGMLYMLQWWAPPVSVRWHPFRRSSTSIVLVTISNATLLKHRPCNPYSSPGHQEQQHLILALDLSWISRSWGANQTCSWFCHPVL